MSDEQTNEFNLELKEADNQNALEALGWDKERGGKLACKMSRFFTLEEEGKFSDSLEKFINTNYFKDLKLPLDKPKHWIALGMAFQEAKNHDCGGSNTGVEVLAGEDAKKKLLEVLSKLKA